MTIAGLVRRSKALYEATPRDVFIVFVLILSASASFGLGVLAERDLEQLARPGGSGFGTSEIPLTAGVLEALKEAAPPAPLPVNLPAGGQVVASKNGTKYFLPWCGGATLILDANKVWFSSREEAEKAGYQPAANCRGL